MKNERDRLAARPFSTAVLDREWRRAATPGLLYRTPADCHWQAKRRGQMRPAYRGMFGFPLISLMGRGQQVIVSLYTCPDVLPGYGPFGNRSTL
jgi:hypothetical protein